MTQYTIRLTNIGKFALNSLPPVSDMWDLSIQRLQTLHLLRHVTLFRWSFHRISICLGH